MLPLTEQTHTSDTIQMSCFNGEYIKRVEAIDLWTIQLKIKVEMCNITSLHIY